MARDAAKCGRVDLKRSPYLALHLIYKDLIFRTRGIYVKAVRYEGRGVAACMCGQTLLIRASLIRMPHNPNTVPGTSSSFLVSDSVIRMFYNPNTFELFG